jgi:hypothetical protein
MKIEKKCLSLLLAFVLLSSSIHSQFIDERLNYETLNGKYLVLNNPLDSGMFAVFHMVLGALSLYEEGTYPGLKVDLDGLLYFDPQKGPHWWEYFFDPIELGHKDIYTHQHILSREETGALWLKAFLFDKFRKNELIQKYIRVKPEILEEIDSYVDSHFKDSYIIGVHHRGTDKVTEWPLIPYEQTIHTLNHIIRNLPKSDVKRLKIYVATDDHYFLDHILERFPYEIIYNDFARSKTSKPIHDHGLTFYSNNYQKGKEALVDCLLLSRCNILVHPGTSMLSIIASSFNPQMPDVNLLLVK